MRVRTLLSACVRSALPHSVCALDRHIKVMQDKVPSAIFILLGILDKSKYSLHIEESL